MNIQQNLSLMEKLAILTDAAKYDVACTSSGADRRGDGRHMGNCLAPGVCHAFAADGRCISLLKILFTNECIFNCAYCQNNCNSDVPRASFTPDEICTLTMEFYRRNYIEGLFLSSGILISPNYTMDLIYQTLYRLRTVHHFNGYIHVKAIPGTDPALIEKAGFLADRMSINLELPTANGLKQLAPCKSRHTILSPMRQIQNGITENQNELMVYRKAPKFVPAGQSTQMIIGATPENDYQIMHVSEALYEKFHLKRVFYCVHQCQRRFVTAGAPRRASAAASTACTRQTGCCAITAFMWMNFCRKTARILIFIWIPSVTGHCVISTHFQSRSTAPVIRHFCASPESDTNPPSGSSPPDGMPRLHLTT